MSPPGPAWTGAAHTPQHTRSLGAALAAAVGPGDVLLLTGPLGAGKTTLVQGLARALGITEPATSPTFVLAHEMRGGRVPLVHVDAYRLGGAVELDDLDLDTDLEQAVVVVEWGGGIAERLAESRLEVDLHRPDVEPGSAAPAAEADVPDEPRRIHVTATGPRWTAAAVERLVAALDHALAAES